MAHEYGHRESIISPWLKRNLWDKIPDWVQPGELGGMFPRYAGPQTQAEYEAQSGVTADKWRQFRDVETRSGERGPETEAQRMQRIREAHPDPVKARGYPMALAQDEFGMYGQAQKDIAAGKFAKEEEDDDMEKLLRYMFLSELMAGMAGGDPPTPYTVRAGPAARAFPTMPSMF